MMSGLPTTNRLILGVLDPVSRRRMSPKSNSAKSIRSVRPRPLRTTRSKSGKEFVALVSLKNSTMLGCPTADLSAATIVSNDFKLVRLKRSTSILAIVILSSVTTLMDKVRLIPSERALCHRGSDIQESPDVADEDVVVLKQRAVP